MKSRENLMSVYSLETLTVDCWGGTMVETMENRMGCWMVRLMVL